MNLDGISVLCFGASYVLAFVLEGSALLWPGRVNRWLRRGVAAAGTLAHVVYVGRNAMPLAGGHSVLMLLALILSVYYLSGTFHYPRTAWGLFVLPVILVLIAIARWQPQTLEPLVPPSDRGEQLWVWLHLLLMLAGMVGLCVACTASLMYLVKWSQLRNKLGPGAGVPMPNLERLETVHRRAVNLAFPLFTSGLLVGVLLMLHTERMPWTDPKLVTAGLLWLAFALLLVVRYGLQIRGRWVAVLTIVAFLLMVAAVVLPALMSTAHPTGRGWP
jgi:ABC-type transport system involved in cytochrome c biogenesis permease subunit